RKENYAGQAATSAISLECRRYRRQELFSSCATAVFRRQCYRRRPINRVTRRKMLLRSGGGAVLAGQHSTISSATKRNSVKRASFKSSRRFFAICWTERTPLNWEANCASSDVN